MTSLVANEGLIICGLCNGTANVYAQVNLGNAAMADRSVLVFLTCLSEWGKAGASAGLPQLRWAGTGEQKVWMVDTGTD